MSKSKNDLAWERMLEEVTAIAKEIETKGYYDIESNVIKEYREPRLACKIDYRQNIPAPLKKEQLSVLAVRNTCYRLARTDPFVNIDQTQFRESDIHGTFSIPPHIQSISPQRISSESKALDAALASGMLEEVVGEKVSLVLRGREFCRPIEFSLPDNRSGYQPIKYHAEQVQLEVDGGYEGKSGIHLIEAKVGWKDNINLRQLLYPHLHYGKLFRKTIKTYVLFYEPDTGCFHFLRFRKGDQYYFSDHRCYDLESTSSSYCWDDLRAVKKDNSKTDKNAPFPQADSFEKILTAFLRLDQFGPLTKERLFADENIKPRQYYYYASTLRWMRLAQKIRDQQGVRYLLTELGASLAKKPTKEILFEMAKIIFSNDLCHLFLFSDEPEIPESIENRNRLNRKKTTYRRRIKTIKSWKKYFQNMFQCT